MCPVFYNSAFRNVFPAVEKNITCGQQMDERDAFELPRNVIRMGYWQTINDENLMEKNFYAATSRDPPFN